MTKKKAKETAVERIMRFEGKYMSRRTYGPMGRNFQLNLHVGVQQFPLDLGEMRTGVKEDEDHYDMCKMMLAKALIAVVDGEKKGA